jgi:hypothetical protein
MSTVIFEDYGLAISEDDQGYYVVYNASDGGVAMREDPITKDEAAQIMAGPRHASRVLLAVQGRLVHTGVRPFKTNMRFREAARD